MTLDQFRAQPHLVKEIRMVFESSDAIKLLFEAMEAENPVNRAPLPNVTPHGANILLGEQIGWNSYKNRFRQAAVPLEDTEPDRGEQSYLEPAEQPATGTENAKG